LLLDPADPEVQAAARRDGIPDDWLDAARRSPVYALAKTYRVALPLHPEFRTMPMVWYIPPLSPVVDALANTGHDGEDLDNLFGAIDTLRIPVGYLAELFTAGDPEPVRQVLRTLSAMRSYLRAINLGAVPDGSVAAAAGHPGAELPALYRLLAVAKYSDRYVIPTAYPGAAPGDGDGGGGAPAGGRLEEPGCSLDYDGGPGMYGAGPFGEA